MIAILGGVGAALAWAASTLCSSRSSRLIHPFSVVAWVMAVGLVITLPMALAKGVPAGLTAGTVGWVVLSGGGNVGGLMLTYAALRIGQVALVAPLVSTEGAIAAVIAVLTGESLAPGVGATLAVIVVGVTLSARPAAGADERARRHHAEAVLLAGAAAATFGASLYATARAASAIPSVWVVLSARVIGTALLLVPLALLGRLHRPGAATWLILASGVCEVVGFFSFTAGARHDIAVAAVLSSQFATLAAFGGYILFGERLGRVQVAGVTAVVAGVAGLSLLTA